MFSFNNPYGACPECTGLGTKLEFDPEMIFDKSLSINEGGIMGKISKPGSWTQGHREALAKHYKFSLDTPIKDLPPEIIDVLLYGSGEQKHFGQDADS